MKEIDEDNDEINEINENQIVINNDYETSNFTDLYPNIYKENCHTISEIRTENKKRLPLLNEIISIGQDKIDIKPPIFYNELVTKKNYDNININTFSDDINTFLIETRKLIDLLQNNNQEKLLQVIIKKNIPYMNYFYSLIFISKQLLLIDSLVRFKYSENRGNLEEYNKLKSKIYSENDYSDMDNYIKKLKVENTPFYDFITEEQTKILKDHIIELLKEEKKMIECFDNVDYIPGLIPISICFNCIEMNVSDTIKSFQKLSEADFKGELLMMTFLNNFSKVDCLSNFINNSCYSFNIDDLLNKKEHESPDWKRIKEHCIKYCPFSKEIIEKGMNTFLKYVNIGYASMSKTKSTINNKFLMFASFGIYSSLYFFSNKKASSESKNFLMNPKAEVVIKILNMLENPVFLEMAKIIFPSVKYNHTFYIKKTQKEIDIKLIEDLCQLTGNFDPSNEEENKKIHELFKGVNSENKYIENDLPLIKQKNERSRTDDNYVKIKIYNHENLNFNSKIKNDSDIINNKDNEVNNKDIQKNELEKNKTILFHVHGGGFIATSPNTHENYLLKWAKQFKIPIFSIDYRLSPRVAFPKALDDVYQSYLWVIKYSAIIFNIEFDEIILAGDSAGGNLICALTYLLILNKVKLPKVIFMFYPALKIDINTIVPSYLNSFDDIILEYHLLKYCIDAYTGKLTDNGKVVTDTRNKFLSPIFMDDNVLKNMPTIRIFGASCDVLRDDIFYFMDKLLKLNRDIFFYEFKYLKHGFLSFDYKILFPELSLISEIIIREIEAYI